MASDRSKQRESFSNSATRPPPRALNVLKFAESRAPELQSLHSIVATRLNNDFRTARNKRRRTTGHDNRRRRKRQRLEQASKRGDADAGREKKKVSRRVRRSLELRGNRKSGFSISGDGTKRMRTHLWHAKRFQMTKQWGFYLPLGLHGRGRGSRAILKRLKSGVLVHDASYSSAVQLEGPEESLFKVLKTVLEPSPSPFAELSNSLSDGACYASAMLHHIGAPDSQLIAPVIYMWRPRSSKDADVYVQKDPILNDHEFEKSGCSASIRLLWIWIHAAAFVEGFHALSLACQKLLEEDGVSINCSSLEGHLGKLEVMGLKAVQTLQKILHPISCMVFKTSEDSRSHKHSTLNDDTCCQLENSSILDYVERLPFRMIIPLIVCDPRDISLRGTKGIATELSCTKSDQFVTDDPVKGSSLTFNDLLSSSEVISSIWGKVNRFHFHGKSLWNSGNSIGPPVDESVLCMEKHQRRLELFNLDNKSSGLSTSEIKDNNDRSCPIFLFKDKHQMGSYTRWSLILPLSWVKAFWIPLISLGAKAIGLRERQWVSFEEGLPSFPIDFPDCKAYSCFMAAKAKVLDENIDHRPLAVRPIRIPIPPPWNCVRHTIVEAFAMVERHNSSFRLDIEGHDVTSVKDTFQGLIGRTSSVLSEYLNETHCQSLLLYHKRKIPKKNCFSNLMDKGILDWIPKRVNCIPLNRRLCFLRVLLHAYKEGVFEEGAVVCAPTLTDLSLWMTRSDEEDRLQVSQPLIRSYFTEEESGKWKLQMPQDLENQQSYRWPIGFVTSGFVRGSTKPSAGAFCEATLLAKLRGEQWCEMQVKGKPNIFVLVRNLRSAVYRLAYATIVLEQQQDDLDFM